MSLWLLLCLLDYSYLLDIARLNIRYSKFVFKNNNQILNEKLNIITSIAVMLKEIKITLLI